MKKGLLIAGAVVVLTTAVWGGVVIHNKTKPLAPYQPKHDDNDPQFIFGSNPDKFSPDVINAAERIYRIESANFTSNIYNKTYSAGMIATSSSSPYGWPSFLNIWAGQSSYAPTGTYLSQNGNQYIKFPTLRAGAFAVCTKLQQYENSHYKADFWNNGQAGSASYLAALNSIQASACYSPTQPSNPLL